MFGFKQGAIGVSMPNDVISKGYIKTRPFQYEQVFYSPSLNFEGTENQFIKAGHAYRYMQITPFRRMVIE